MRLGNVEKLRFNSCGAICFEGNIAFYEKSGFKYASEYGIRYHGLEEGQDASFFLCIEFIPGYLDGISGEYATPKSYFVNEKEAEEFDQLFPYKEKRYQNGVLALLLVPLYSFTSLAD